MFKYHQYCPVARACEVIADRWTPLIVRELLFGSRHFNELQRGLPQSRDRSSLPVSGISKTTASSNGSRARGRTSRSTPSPRRETIWRT